MYVSLTAGPAGPEASSAFQTTLSNPFRPPCSEFGPLLTASLYSLPSSVNCPLAIRLATRPVVAPKCGMAGQVAREVVEAEDDVGRSSRSGPARGAR